MKYGFLIGFVALVTWAEASERRYVDQSFGQEVATLYRQANGLPPGEVTGLSIDANGNVSVTTPRGSARFLQDNWQQDQTKVIPPSPPGPPNIRTRHVVQGPGNRWAAAGEDGLYERVDEGPWKRLVVADGLGRLWATKDVRAVIYDRDGRLWFGVLAGLGRRDLDGRWHFFEGKDGLPYNRFTCAAAAPDGSVWWGTEKGAIRHTGDAWHYRQGKRWLVDDAVVDIAVDAEGQVWIASPSGVARISFRTMTLAQKARHYEKEIETLIKRTPFGYLAPVRLAGPGDRRDVRRSDNDNDGLWTSMYGAGQCFAFAATHDPQAKARAKQAFEALRFLQVVTQGGAHSPPPGYVARTIRSTSLPDPNIGRIERDRQQQETGDRRWKAYEPRWPRSADGEWYWKSDTSSDELDGHFFFYPLYHDLVAETTSEKQRVKDVVIGLADHFIDNGFNLIDHDGKPTRWGYFSPEHLNHDPDWYIERGLNSLSLLAYLTVAEHLTDDRKYTAAMDHLKRNAAYDLNAMVPKIHRGFGSGNQSDDEMAFMSFYNLLQYSRDESLKSEIRKAFHTYWTLEEPELNPFFNFAYAACAEGQEVTNPWGTYDVSPWSGWLEDSVATLRAFPLDRADWGHQNAHRLDIVPMPRQQTTDLLDEPRRARGLRVNGKVLPVDERYFNHWNTDPYTLDYGGNGSGLGCGTVFLLPYYMGLYHGYILATDARN